MKRLKSNLFNNWPLLIPFLEIKACAIKLLFRHVNIKEPYSGPICKEVTLKNF